MRTDITLDGRQVICPNSSLIGYSTCRARVGYFLAYRDTDSELHLARMLARIKFASTAGAVYKDSKGITRAYIQNHILGMVLGMEGTHAFERWIDPLSVQVVYRQPPARMAAFFFADKLPYDVHMLRRLIEHGTLSDQFVDQHPARVEQFKARDYWLTLTPSEQHRFTAMSRMDNHAVDCFTLAYQNRKGAK